MLLLERGVSTLEVGLASGGCCRSALPQEPDMGWHFSQELSQAGSRGHGQTNPGTHLTRGKCPLGRKKQLFGQKSKKMKDRQCKERSSWHCLCFHACAEETFAGAKPCAFPHGHRSCKEGLGEQGDLPLSFTLTQNRCGRGRLGLANCCEPSTGL